MEKITNFLTDNVYVQDPRSSCLTVSLNDFLNVDLKNDLKNVSYTDVLIKYPNWEKNSDFFKFINESTLDELRNNKRFFLFLIVQLKVIPRCLNLRILIYYITTVKNIIFHQIKYSMYRQMHKIQKT